MNMTLFFTTELFRSILSLLLAAAITSYSIPAIIQLSHEKLLHKTANGRDSHNGSIPTLGGIAIFASIGISALIFLDATILPSLQYFMVGIVIIFMMGVKDDLFVVSPYTKLSGEIASFLLLIILGNIRITSLHGFLGIHEISYVTSVFLTLITGLGIINSINLVDGIDGLAAGLSSLVTITFATWFYFNRQSELLVICSAVTGSLLAFIYFNVYGKKNKIFMGDTGSLILGFIITFFIINFLESSLPGRAVCHIQAAPAVALGILAIPIYDTLRVFWIRILRKQSPFHADRLHLHHLLLNAGFSHKRATLTLVLINLLFIIISFTLQVFTANIIYIILILLTLCIIMTEVFEYLKRANEKNGTV